MTMTIDLPTITYQGTTFFPTTSTNALATAAVTTTTTNKYGAIGSKPTTNKQQQSLSLYPQQQTNSSMVIALRWLTSIQDATQCLRNPNERFMPHSAEATEHALHYLMKLESTLAKKESEWDQGPTEDPPVFVPYQPRIKAQAVKSKINNNKKLLDQSPTSVVVWNNNDGTSINKNGSNFNRFALFEDAESDDDDDSDVDERSLSTQAEDKPHSDDDNDNNAGAVVTGQALVLSSSSYASSSLDDDDDDLEEAGDVPTLNRIAHFPTGSIMVMRRLMIRIVTAQSELFAYQASGYRRRQLWSLAAENCHASLIKIHQGLLLADSEISRCFAVGAAMHQPLMEDASIVEVAVKSLTKERDSFVQKALTAKHQLVRKLEASYIGRYNAQKRLGDKWYKKSGTSGSGSGSSRRHGSSSGRNSGSAGGAKKVDFAKQRSEQEALLVEIQLALDHINQWDCQSLQVSADQLKLRLQPAPAVMAGKPRYNQRRPADMKGRVDVVLYPDPSLFGWKFTGSYLEGNDRIEMFEKGNLNLDFHYTVPKVELSWKYLSRGGGTTFFSSEGPVDSKFYLELLQSPRPWEVAKSYYANNNTNWTLPLTRQVV